MDYTGVLKRAWDVTWRYKALWVLGLFVGGGSARVNSGSSSPSSSSLPISGLNGSQIQSFLTQYMPLIAIGVFVGIVVALLFTVVSVAARGGLIHLINEAEEGREVRLGAGWHAGFSKFWRLFGVGFIAGLPLFLLGLLMVALIGGSIFAAVGANALSGASDTQLARALAGPLLGGICFGTILGFVFIFFAIVLGMVESLGWRYVMLEDRGALESVKQGWRDVWAKRGAFAMLLWLVLVGIVVAMAFGFVGAIFAIPALALAGGSGSAAGLGIAGIGGLILIVPAAIYGTFNEAVWTIFFRRMTGRERPVALAYAQPAPGTEGYVPPAPPVPAAPMGYVPPVPVQQPLEVPAPEPVYAPAPEPMPEPAVEPEPVFAPEPEMPAEPEAAAPVDVPPPPASDV